MVSFYGNCYKLKNEINLQNLSIVKLTHAFDMTHDIYIWKQIYFK